MNQYRLPPNQREPVILQRYDLANGQPVILHRKPDIEPGKGQAVNPSGLALVAGAGVVAENADGGGALVFRQKLQKGRGEGHLQKKVICGVREAAQGIGMGVCVGDVGFDVENGGAVHQVRAGNVDDRAKLLRHFHTLEPDAAQSQIVGPEGGPGGEHAHAGVAAQAGRADRGAPAGPDRLGKLPDDPKMGKTVKSPQRIGVAVLRLKHDGRMQLLHQMGLARDAEFRGKIAVHSGDDIDLYFHM